MVFADDLMNSNKVSRNNGRTPFYFVPNEHIMTTFEFKVTKAKE